MPTHLKKPHPFGRGSSQSRLSSVPASLVKAFAHRLDPILPKIGVTDFLELFLFPKPLENGFQLLLAEAEIPTELGQAPQHAFVCNQDVGPDLVIGLIWVLEPGTVCDEWAQCRLQLSICTIKAVSGGSHLEAWA